MRFSSIFTCTIAILGASLCASAQEATPAKDAQPIAPRAAPSDYMVQGKAGDYTIAAEFVGHSVPTPQSTYTSTDYVVVEVAVYGPADAKLKLAVGDYSLRINDKKAPIPSQPYGLVFRSLKDPQWEPPPTEPKSKGSIGGGQNKDDPPPSPPKMPFPLVRTMEQRVQKASMPEGDRVLPQAGLIYFPYSGKESGIKTVELIYSGPAGSATLTLR